MTLSSITLMVYTFIQQRDASNQARFVTAQEVGVRYDLALAEGVYNELLGWRDGSVRKKNQANQL